MIIILALISDSRIREPGVLDLILLTMQAIVEEAINTPYQMETSVYFWCMWYKGIRLKQEEATTEFHPLKMDQMDPDMTQCLRMMERL